PPGDAVTVARGPVHALCGTHLGEPEPLGQAYRAPEGCRLVEQGGDERAALLREKPMSTGGGLDLRLRKAFGEERRPLVRQRRGGWPRDHPGRDDGACVLSREMRTVQAQVFEEDAPAGAHGVVLSVPVVALAEPTVDQPDHAGAAVMCLHLPLLCERRLTLAGEHHAVRRLPDGDACEGLTEAGAEVHANGA